MIKRCALLIVAVLGGLGAYFLRLYQRNTGFIPDSSMPISSAPSATYLILLSTLVIILAILLSFHLNKKRDTSLHIEVPPFPLLLIGCFAAAATLLSALYQGIDVVSAYTVLGEFGAVQVKPSLLTTLFFIFTALAGLALFKIAFSQFSGKNLSSSLALLVPGFTMCIWLMLSYQSWAQNPYLQDYGYSLFALITLMLAHYYFAANYFERSSPVKTQLFATLAIYFTMIALADSPDTISFYLYIAQLFYFIPVTVLVPSVPKVEEDNSADETIKEEHPHD